MKTSTEEETEEEEAEKVDEAEEKEEELEEEEEEDVEMSPRREKPNKILTRAYPSTFSKAVERMSDAQKQWVNEAGFGPLLSFSLMETLPHSTIVNCLWWFDQEKSEMVLSNNRSIKITENDVHGTLGIPKGDLEVTFGNSKEKIKHWVSQFGGKLASRITEKNVRVKMAESREADDHFKENFMVLMSNMFIRTSKGSFVCTKILKFSENFDNAKNYNWCNLVLNELKEAHENWWINPQTQYYTGSYVFLLVSFFLKNSSVCIAVHSSLLIHTNTFVIFYSTLVLLPCSNQSS